MYLYGQYCPVARASEILADRWTPLIVRELLAGVERFNDLDRGLPGISRALLVERLRRLERTGIVERRPAPSRLTAYHLTPAGRELQRVIDVLGGWGRAGRSAIRSRVSSIPSCFCGGCGAAFTGIACLRDASSSNSIFAAVVPAATGSFSSAATCRCA